jgi:FkbM family methyltransferase
VLRFLPLLYRLCLLATRHHGLFTLARVHHRTFANGQITRLPGGALLFIPPDPHYFGFLTGIHERHVASAIRKFVVPGSICFDIGANIGFFATMMARRAGNRGQVLAFEPVPETFQILQKNAELSTRAGLNLKPVCAAVSCVVGQVTIRRREYSTHHEVSLQTPTGQSESQPTKATTFSAVLEALGENISIALAKIDVEGHELPVIEGARSAMRSGKIRRMVIEITPGTDAAAISTILIEHRALVRPWINRRWADISLKNLPFRTDVFVEFP